MTIAPMQKRSDDEIRKLYADALAHVKQRHGSHPDDSKKDFDDMLKMYPYFVDAVAEYRRRGFDKADGQ